MQNALEGYARQLGIVSNRLEDVMDALMDIEYLNGGCWGALEPLPSLQEDVLGTAQARFVVTHAKLCMSMDELETHVVEAKRALDSLVLRGGGSLHGARDAYAWLEEDLRKRRAIARDLATQRDRSILASYQDFSRLSAASLPTLLL